MSSAVEWDKTFMRIAKEMAKHSTCCRKQVGAVLVKNRRVISTGYNGVPSGLRHCCDRFTPCDRAKPDFYDVHGVFSRNFEVHAEANCLLETAKNEISPEGTTLYTTLSPCQDCAKIICAAGVTRIVYEELYDRDQKGIELLAEMGIDVDQVVVD